MLSVGLIIFRRLIPHSYWTWGWLFSSPAISLLNCYLVCLPAQQVTMSSRIGQKEQCTRELQDSEWLPMISREIILIHLYSFLILNILNSRELPVILNDSAWYHMKWRNYNLISKHIDMEYELCVYIGVWGLTNSPLRLLSFNVPSHP